MLSEAPNVLSRSCVARLLFLSQHQANSFTCYMYALISVQLLFSFLRVFLFVFIFSYAPFLFCAFCEHITALLGGMHASVCRTCSFWVAMCNSAQLHHHKVKDHNKVKDSSRFQVAALLSRPPSCHQEPIVIFMQ